MTRINGGMDRFAYSPDGQRFRHRESDGVETFYGRGGYEKNYRAGAVEHRHHLPGMIVNITGASAATGIKVVTYRHTDRLGSTVALSNATGTITERRSFDAFGKARNGDFTDRIGGRLDLDPPQNRGFTDHEHLDNTRLIHMNGRTYDYQLGRFLAVDPFIQFPANSQSLNPYSYLMNNPMSGTDPSGYCVTYTGSRIPSCGGYGPNFLRITYVSGSPEANTNGAHLAQPPSGYTQNDRAPERVGSQENRSQQSDASNWTRALGVLRMLGGGLTAAGGAIAGGTPNPCSGTCFLVALLGADQAAAGWLEFTSGFPHRSLVNQAVVGLTGSETMGMGADLASGLSPAAPGSAGFVALRLESRAAGTASATDDLARGFTSSEAMVLSEASEILGSSQMSVLRAAHASNLEASISVGPRTIVYAPDLPASGMTLFGDDGFVLGRNAFSSDGELGRTLLHELYRLRHSTATNGVSRSLATEETIAAFDFAERGAKRLGL